MNLLLSCLALCSQSPPPKGRSAWWRDPIWQQQAKRIRPTEPYLTANSSSCCRRLGSSCRAKRPLRQLRLLIRLSHLPSHPHGRRPTAAFGREDLKFRGCAECSWRSQGASLGLPRPNPLVSRRPWSYLRSRLRVGARRLSLVVSKSIPFKAVSCGRLSASGRMPTLLRPGSIQEQVAISLTILVGGCVRAKVECFPAGG
jgi:hypothetical protein